MDGLSRRQTLPLTNLEARNTCWWGTLQVSTAQLLRYISPMSLRTLKAGRHGEKKAPILQWQKVKSVCVCPHSGLHTRAPWRSKGPRHYDYRNLWRAETQSPHPRGMAGPCKWAMVMFLSLSYFSKGKGLLWRAADTGELGPGLNFRLCSSGARIKLISY